MVGINKACFNSSAISEIYDKTGELIETLKERIEEKQRLKDGNIITKDVLTRWFFDEDSTGSSASRDKIFDFLLSPKPKEWIIQYAEIACEALWGNKRLSEALLGYKACANEAKEVGNSDKRLEIFSRILSDDHVSAQMFEVKKNAYFNGYRLLEADDLKRPVNNNTLCSSIERIKSLRTTKHSVLEEFLDDCKVIFNYDDFSSNYRDKLLNAPNVSVCPYCNRQYISPFGTKGLTRNTADIDHFYNKDRFPYLALSLYNFVPSCQICNSRFKLAMDFYAKPHVYPYDIGYAQDARFEIDNIDAIINNNVRPELNIRIPLGSKEVDNSLETFHIRELYQNHWDYAKEIINKARIFNKTQLDEYYRNYWGLFSSKEELYRTVYGNYLEEKNQGKRPLAKLTQDLLIDLGVRIDDESEEMESDN